MVTELTNVSFAISLIKTVQIKQKNLSFGRLNASSTSLNYSRANEGKNSGIISVDGYKCGVVNGEILPILAAVKVDDAFANRGRV
jgi:hypothetical protein